MKKCYLLECNCKFWNLPCEVICDTDKQSLIKPNVFEVLKQLDLPILANPTVLGRKCMSFSQLNISGGCWKPGPLVRTQWFSVRVVHLLH